ncbi:MAG: tRNA (adenosine(37)-N6)-dimethylallyltransferase MiaA [Candidatus Firestonebacteria bacterium]|nr:tRNA (adenosine(37)-N6)-dimethylallyltransferase MiaA [Candidatus Firestonebacteria bacterium]
MQKELLIILGPTASGKSKLALILAEKNSAEIISADSRQIYKFMDIGTAKPLKEDLQHISHHMIDIVTPDELYSAGEYKNEAEKIIQEIFERGKNVIITGGTGLYIRALIEGIFNSPRRDNKIQEELEKIALEKGHGVLYNELKKVDPISAEKIHINDKYRIIRALEVFKQTGAPISRHKTKSTMPINYKYKIFGLNLRREKLYRRINERVDKMISSGLLDEIKKLKQMGYNKSSPGFEGIGYQELWDYLEGEQTLEKAIELIKQNTRKYAKRQITWFKKLKEVTWFDVECMSLSEIAERISKEL